MNYYKTDSIVVMDNKNPFGIITRSDIKKRVYRKNLDPHLLKVEDIMSYPVICISLDTDQDKAEYILSQNKIKRLPIITRTSRGNILLGLYTKKNETNTIDEKGINLKNLLQSQLCIKILE
jgi:CBS domain-containing protein